MRVDVVSIFPDYLQPLRLSLPGRAVGRGLVDLTVHDLRRWTHDRHRTVDDSPYGGGAGMVMKPEPWGEAFDELLSGALDPLVVVPTPGGARFTQEVAATLAREQHLVVACGRYEGIDQRVVDDARSRARVQELSVGDYVLNGGEAAALVVLEAVLRLLPGFLGNAASLAEESHATPGLLEYPVYTRPPSWRGRDVPGVLLSGDHAAVAAWRAREAQRRTARHRPDLLASSRAADASALDQALDTSGWLGQPVSCSPATRADAPELLVLQRACWAPRAASDASARAVVEEHLGAVEDGVERWTTLVLRVSGRLVGSVRARLLVPDPAPGRAAEPPGDRPGPVPAEPEWRVDRLMVAPDLEGHGFGRWLLARIEELTPAHSRWVGLRADPASTRALRLLHRAGFRPARAQTDPSVLHLVKRHR